MKIYRDALTMRSKTNILLTGATGFVGRALLAKLLENGEYNVTAALRDKSGFNATQAELCWAIFLKALNWFAAVNNQRVVIHTAARNHSHWELKVLMLWKSIGV